MTTILTLDEDQFEARYETLARPDGSTLRDYVEVKDADPRHVWSIVETDDEYLFALPGFHHVNTLGYILTANPWMDENVEAIWCEGVDDAS